MTGKASLLFELHGGAQFDMVPLLVTVALEEEDDKFTQKLHIGL